VSLNALLFTVIYRVLPKQSVRWRDALAGGVLVAIIWEVGQQLLAPLVIGEKYSAYGVVGSFIAVMLWMYYASAVLFIGAEFVQILWRQHRPLTTSEQAGP
jgi:membrane protein